MKNWLELHPEWTAILIIVVVCIVAQFVDDKIELFAAAALFLSASGFANTLWLNRRINRLQDVLYEKNLAEPGDFTIAKHTND